MVALSDNLVAVVSGSKVTVTGASIIAAITVSGIIYWLQQRRKATANNIPSVWKPVGKIQQLYIYPLKSGKSIELEEAECTPLGLRQVPTRRGSYDGSDGEQEKFILQDRYFMIYQEKSKKFLTARQKHSTLLITVNSDGPDSVTLKAAPNSDNEITFRVSKDTRRRVKCSMHSDEQIDVLDCGDEVAAWLSKVIFGKDSGLRLGYYPDDSEKLRSVINGPWNKLKKYMNDKDFGAYSDIASYMLLTQNSVNDLKSRLAPEAGDVTAAHFRPNIIVSGPNISPYDEDNWRWIKIGDEVVMKGFKPCTRCAMVTLDPQKAVANPAKEPLVTLKKYRQVSDPDLKVIEGNSPVFGRYFGLYSPGKVSVGDIVYMPA